MSEQSFQYRAGISNVGSYQASGIPWVTSSLAVGTSSVVQITFPSVTKTVSVKNTGSGTLKVGFSSAGITASNNYLTLSGSEVFTSDLRITKLYLLSSGSANTATVVAGLTGISFDQLPNSWSGSAGIG